MIKKIYFWIILIIVIILSSFYFIYFNSKNPTSVYLKTIFPNSLKSVIRDTFFIISEKNKNINELEIFSYDLLNEQKNLKTDFIVNLTSNKKINNNYELKKFQLPFQKREISNKTIAHLDIYNNFIFIISGNGELYYFDKNILSDKKILFKKIDNNLTDLIKDLRFFDTKKLILASDEISIKDMLILQNKIFLSYTKEIKQDCYNISIISGEINFNNINFQEFFTHQECLSFKKVYGFNAQQSGGRMVKYKNNKILLTVGEFRSRRLAQDDESLFGKIISIDLGTKEPEIFSKGHRNPQGLFYDEVNNLIISSEHGPYGGDEINLISKGKNYGWPIASYGEHYDGKFRKNSPLKKSHKENNFEEPLHYFNPSIGPSEIINLNNKKQYVLSSLVAKKLFIFFLDHENRLKVIEEIYIGERIRDIIYVENLGMYLLILENSPSLGIFQINN